MKNEKESNFKGTLENFLGYFSSILSERLFPRRKESPEKFTQNIEEVILIIEKRIFRKIFNFIVLAGGIILLIIALISYLKNFLNWGNILSYFSVGIILLIIGLIMKLKEQEVLKNGK